MYFTHHFAHRETLSRAHSWLTRLGFNSRQIETHASGIPRIAIVVDPHRLDAVKMLINAAECADSDGFPSFWDEARQPHCTPKEYHEDLPSEGRKPHSSVIGWHPLD